MAVALQTNRNRAFALAVALGVNALLLAALLGLGSGITAPGDRGTDLVAIDLSEPPPPAPPADRRDEGEAAPPSRGRTGEPSPPEPPHPLPSQTPAEVSRDVGSAAASGAGAAAGSGAGQGGEGSGRGAGAGGSGTGSGAVSPPVHIAGAITDADYARARPPAGAMGTVYIAFRVRPDGVPDRCRVVGSSGYEVFDRATCRLFEQRFRFRPARDARGRAVAYELRTDFTWRPR